MSSSTESLAEPTIADDLLDLDIVVVPGRSDQAREPGIHFDTDDNCGKTCESACTPSCTDGDDD